MKTAIVIVAAGRGTRAGEGVPKQYRDLAGRTVLRRTIETFLAVPECHIVQCVIGTNDAELFARSKPDDPRVTNAVIGGADRQASVLAGLEALPADCDLVLIHDGARALVPHDLIARVIACVDEIGSGALPVLPIASTILRVSNDAVSEAIDREGLVTAQTPQGFPYAAILEAHRAAANGPRFTDDASLARASGMAVHSVPGNARNIKITRPEDFALATALLDTVPEHTVPDIRVGHGYDTHRLTEGDHVWLCGLRIPHTATLDGHSDADVGLHALTDAILATIGAGDIGSHFPPSDPQWRGAASDQFLAHALDLVTDAGGRLTHADVTIVCEAPKIGPHRDAMRQRIAEILQTDIARVSVKATTNEERGFVGRNEGIVALATATVGFA